MKKIDIVVICGPTATGKTALSIKVAQERNGEIISADSRQVYRHLNIGTAKITPDEMGGVPHRLIDVADPTDIFSVSEYKKMAQTAIENIHARGKLPILVGGSGMYIDAVVYDRNFPQVPPNETLRRELEQKSLNELQTILQELDPERYENIDEQNPVRLVRAIEIAATLGKVPKSTPADSPYKVEWIYLDLPDEELRERIHARNMARLENGLIEEVQGLNNIHKLSWERMEALGLEYRYVSRFIRGEIASKQELLELLDLKIWQYAKRQRTWFKKYVN